MLRVAPPVPVELPRTSADIRRAVRRMNVLALYEERAKVARERFEQRPSRANKRALHDARERWFAVAFPAGERR